MKTLIIFVLFVMGLSSCIDEENLFYGYVPVDVKTKIEWTEYSPQCYDSRSSVLVVVSNKDTIKAFFNDRGFFSGSNLLIHRDSYPPAIGKTIFVRGYKDKDEGYLIEEAALISLN